MVSVYAERSLEMHALNRSGIAGDHAVGSGVEEDGLKRAPRFVHLIGF